MTVNEQNLFEKNNNKRTVTVLGKKDLIILSSVFVLWKGSVIFVIILSLKN